MVIIKRYQNQPTIQDHRGDTYSSRYKRLSKKTKFFTIKTTTPTTFDLLSAQQYGTPVLFWLIADLNDYIDPSITLPAGLEIKIPQI